MNRKIMEVVNSEIMVLGVSQVTMGVTQVTMGVTQVTQVTMGVTYVTQVTKCNGGIKNEIH